MLTLAIRMRLLMLILTFSMHARPFYLSDKLGVFTLIGQGSI